MTHKKTPSQLGRDPDELEPGHAPTGWYTPEWSAAKELPLTCERCGLPFDRTGRSRWLSPALQATTGKTNAECPRFVGRREAWTCEGVALVVHG